MQRIRAAVGASADPDPVLDLHVFHRREVHAVDALCAGAQRRLFLDVPLRAIVAPDHKNFVPDAHAWRTLLDGVHGVGWEQSAIDWMESAIGIEPFPPHDALGSLRFQAAGGALRGTHGMHRLVAAVCWLAATKGDDARRRGTEAVLRKVDVRLHEIHPEAAELVVMAVDHGACADISEHGTGVYLRVVDRRATLPRPADWRRVMANEPQTLTVVPPRRYTRTDFAVLRAFVQRIEPAAIARRYYDVEDPERAPHAATPEAMARCLGTMRDELVRLALINGSHVLADHLKTSIRKHGSAKLTAVTLRMVEQAVQLAVATPAPAHGVGLWFRPLVARRLTAEGISTLQELIDWCNRHGGSWWRSVPRIGPLRARTIVAWLRRHEATLGARVDADVDVRMLVPEPGAGQAERPGRAVVIGGPPDAPRLAPFERLAVPAELSGGEGPHGTARRGTNRATAFAFIRAPHDLAAIHAYLHRYRDRPATCRAHTRELERLVLWAVIVRGTAVSSMTVEDCEDCEAYKDFLAHPAPAFSGPKRPRAGGRWRPFTGALSAGSQAYAVRTLRAAFAWLVDVRYLAGNPWAAVTDPVTVTRKVAVQVERALPAQLWATVRTALDAHCQPVEMDNEAGDEGNDDADQRNDEARQWRIACVAILLMGDSGLRRAEGASARREDLRLSPYSTAAAPVWALTVIGKRRRQRTVPVSAATVRALRLHWADRGRDFDETAADGPLVAPIVIPDTRAAQERHAGVNGAEAAYAADALARMVRIALRRLTDTLAAAGALSTEDRARLTAASAHAFRHTFGTGAVARDMPVDVVQQILGHASLQITSIYVRAGQQRMLEAAARYCRNDEDRDVAVDPA